MTNACGVILPASRSCACDPENVSIVGVGQSSQVNRPLSAFRRLYSLIICASSVSLTVASRPAVVAEGRPAAIWRCDDLGEVMVAACVDRWPRDILKRLIEMHVAGVAEGQRVEKVRRRQAELARRAASADEDAPATPGMR